MCSQNTSGGCLFVLHTTALSQTVQKQPSSASSPPGERLQLMELSKQLFLRKWQTQRKEEHNRGRCMQMNCSHKSTVWFSHEFCHFSCLQREGICALRSQIKDCTPDFPSSPFSSRGGNRDLDQYNGMHFLSHMVTAQRASPMPK